MNEGAIAAMNKPSAFIWVVLLIVSLVGEAWCFISGLCILAVAIRSENVEERESLFQFAGGWAIGWVLFLGLMLVALVRVLRIVSKQAPRQDVSELPSSV